MAAQAWKFYTQAKKRLGGGTLALANASTAFGIALFKSTSNAASGAGTLQYLSSISNQVTEQYGYSSSGKALSSVVWTVSGTAVKFDAADVVWTATGGNITSIMFAVLYKSGATSGSSLLVAYASLSSDAFALNSGNTLTLQHAAGGIFTLS